jgi:cytochrome oxidase Cu insertion factor (SCO1/SenC/PrrC family)
MRRLCLHHIVGFCCAAALAGAGGGLRAQEVYRLPSHWLDDQARPYELSTLQGRWTVLTMAYGACRRICSTSLRLMENLQVMADEKAVALDFVVVGLDPAQDKPADWAALRATRKLLRPNWHFLSGDEAATGALAQRLGVRYWRYGEHTVHDFKIVLVAPDGRVQRSLVHFNGELSTLLP